MCVVVAAFIMVTCHLRCIFLIGQNKKFLYFERIDAGIFHSVVLHDVHCAPSK